MSSPRKPGWLMTVAQHAHYFNLLGEVYEKHGVPSREREAYRKKIHTAVFDAPISAKEIDSTEMFGKIKNHLLMLLDNVKATVETDHPEHDQQRRLLHNLEHYYFPLLRVMLAVESENRDRTKNGRALSPLPRGEGQGEGQTGSSFDPAAAYARAIAKARWNREHLVDLTVQQLGYLRMDLQRAIQSKRKAAAMTVHDMHQAANMSCPFNCKQCNGTVAVLTLVHADPDDDNVPF